MQIEYLIFYNNQDGFCNWGIDRFLLMNEKITTLFLNNRAIERRENRVGKSCEFRTYYGKIAYECTLDEILLLQTLYFTDHDMSERIYIINRYTTYSRIWDLIKEHKK